MAEEAKTTAGDAALASGPDADDQQSTAVQDSDQDGAAQATTSDGDADDGAKDVVDPRIAANEVALKDTQRAFHAKAQEVADLKTQVEEMEKGIRAAGDKQQKQEFDSYLEQFDEDQRPLVKHMYGVFDQRDQLLMQEIKGLRAELGNQITESGAEYNEVQGILESLKDDADFSGLSMAAKVRIAKNIKAQSSTEPAQPPAKKPPTAPTGTKRVSDTAPKGEKQFSEKELAFIKRGLDDKQKNTLI